MGTQMRHNIMPVGASTKVRHNEVWANVISASKPFVYRTGKHGSAAMILCFVPKGGSTMWSFVMAKQLGIDVVNETSGRIIWAHSHSKLPYVVDSLQWESLLNNAKTKRYMFVRHPHSRLLSAYLNKVKPGLISVRGYNATTGDFKDFVRALTRVPLASLDQHIQLQTLLCGLPQGVRYQRFLRVEEMGQWYRTIVCALRLEGAVSGGWRLFNRWTAGINRTREGEQDCFVRTHDCGCKIDCDGATCNAADGLRGEGSRHIGLSASFTGAATALEQHYDLATAEAVNTWAAQDLAMLGYRRWRPGTPLMHRVGVA